MKFEGTITHKTEKIQIGANNIDKMSIILEQTGDSKYPSTIVVDLFGEKCMLVGGLDVGSVVSAKLNFKAREYNGKRYNGVSAWSIDTISTVEDSDGDKELSDSLPF